MYIEVKVVELIEEEIIKLAVVVDDHSTLQQFINFFLFLHQSNLNFDDFY